MKSRFNAPRLILVTILILAAILTTLLRRSKEPSGADFSTIREAERIFEVREMAAQQRVGGRLGLLILGNRPDELQKAAVSSYSHRDWFETIRSLFITGKFGGLSPRVQQLLLDLSLERLKEIPRADSTLLELACAQIERLPVPAPDSIAGRTLKELIRQKETAPAIHWLTFRKLLAQNPAPEAAVLDIFIQLLKRAQPPSEAMNMIEDVRNPEVRKNLARAASSAWKGYSKPGRNLAVKTLARNIALIPEDYKRVRSFSASLIKSNSPEEIESGLRAMTSILDFKKLDASESEKLRGWIRAIPEEKSNPIIQGRVKILLVKISGEAD